VLAFPGEQYGLATIQVLMPIRQPTFTTVSQSSSMLFFTKSSSSVTSPGGYKTITV
jgi:hypothetical protein